MTDPMSLKPGSQEHTDYYNQFGTGEGPAVDTTEKPKVANQYVGNVLANELDAFNSPSYNLKLYMIGAGTSAGAGATTQNTDDVSSDDIRKDAGKSTIQTSGAGFLNNAVRAKPEQTVVLAQTGVTEVGIDNVELVTVPGGVGGSEQSTLNFTITQPNAADFPDQIIKARAFLGIPLSATDTPLFLEINFTGYSEAEGVGSQDGDGSGKPLTGAEQIGPYIFPLHLKNFSMDISTGGSSYDFECVVKDDLYSADIFFRLKKMFTTTGDTIYEHLLDLQTQINKHNEKNNAVERIDFRLDQQKKTVTGLEIEDQTLDITQAEKIAFDKQCKVSDATDVRQAVSVVKETATYYPGRNDPGRTGEIQKVTVETGKKYVKLDFKQGMKIDDIVGLLLSMNTEFMMKADRSMDPLNPSNEEVDNTKQVMWYRIKGSVQYTLWDEKRKQHQKTAYILPYTFMTNKSEIAGFPWVVEAANKMSKDDMAQRVNQMNIRKAYEYIFTGRNDQITNLNIQYKNGIALLLPPDRGLLGDISLNAKSILNSNPVPKTENIRDGVDKLITSAGSGGGLNRSGGNFFEQLSNLRKKGQEYMEKIGAAANFKDEQIKDLINNANGDAAKQLEELLANQATAQVIADQLGPEGSATNQANVTTQSDAIAPSGFVYGGDLSGNTQYSDQLHTNARKGDSVNYKETDGGETESNDTGLELTYQELNKTGFTNITPTKDIKGNLFTYLYDQHAAQDFLMTLDMQVRGDPWWLGKTPQPAGIDQNPAGMSIETSLDVPTDSEDYLTTDLDNFFLFSLNSPRFFDPNILDEDDNTGLWKGAEDETSYFMSGIYRVKTAIHTFNSGKYLVDITGVKETAINLNKLTRMGQFSYIDENRTGLTARDQDDVLTEEEFNNRYGSQNHGAYFVRGMVRSSDKTATELHDAGKITSAQLTAYKNWQKSLRKTPNLNGLGSSNLPFGG